MGTLRHEELRLLEEYSSYEQGTLQLEEQSLCSALDKLSAVEVVCPLCKKSTLMLNKSVIFCKCGLRIDTEQDGLSLGNVQRLLEMGLEQHGAACHCEPVYSLVSDAGPTNLLMTCPDCDWMSVVI
ncbi:RPA-interacting protein A-like [Mya arenaria]|uniref:RPA-interacting protein A-like n=1 Tax=Mya arenaria TaxID=6604 RepID=UPI0022E8D7E5|nr:RPA-interacting protein A-like [Mya arenaria]